jgi:hypothetical protein
MQDHDSPLILLRPLSLLRSPILQRGKPVERSGSPQPERSPIGEYPD